MKFPQAWCLLASLAALSAASPVSVEQDGAVVKRDNDPSPPAFTSSSPPPSTSPPPTATPPLPTTTRPLTTSRRFLPSEPVITLTGPSLTIDITSPTIIITRTVPMISASVLDGRQQPDPTLSIARAVMTPYLYGCTKEQHDIVQNAWNEANAIAQVHKEWRPPGPVAYNDWQESMDMYIGTDSFNDQDFFGRDGPLKRNILRQAGLREYDSSNSPYWSYTYMYCDEKLLPRMADAPEISECDKPKMPGKKVTAYSFAYDGKPFGWNAKYVVLCPRFFDDDVVSLVDMTNKAKKDPSLAMIMDNWRKIKARVILHTSYYWDQVVSSPAATVDNATAPAEVVALAKDQNAAGSKVNAESWAQAAIGAYLQKTFALNGTAPVPASMAAEKGISTATSNLEDDLEEKWLPTPPEGWQTPVLIDASSYAPDMTNVTTLYSADTAKKAAAAVFELEKIWSHSNDTNGTTS